MKITPIQFAAAAARRALSLIEIMVTVALLAVIILGLVLMFNQTRRAFTIGLNQGDYMESGRAAMELILRDLESITPSYQRNVDNFYADISLNYVALLQSLTDPADVRTNTLESVYFISRSNQQWTALGYKVDPNSMFDQIGTLYRFSATLSNSTDNRRTVFVNSTNMNTSNFNRVVDGVISFRIRTFDTRGIPVRGRNRDNTITAIPNRGEYFYRYLEDDVPAFIEVELSLLEARTFERYRSMAGNPANAATFLAAHAGQVHVFRQRIPIRCVDPNTRFPLFSP